jgi:hypothetical protein
LQERSKETASLDPTTRNNHQNKLALWIRIENESLFLSEACRRKLLFLGKVVQTHDQILLDIGKGLFVHSWRVLPLLHLQESLNFQSK